MRISDWSSDVCSSDLAFDRQADGGEAVDEAEDQRALRADHHIVDGFLLHEGDEAVDILGGDGDTLGFLGDAGVARRAEQLVAERRGRDGPAQRMLAPAAAHNPDLHATRSEEHTSELQSL